MQLQDMAQNSFFPDAIEREATKARANARANAHHHNCLPSKDIMPKTTQTILTTSCEIYIEPLLRPFLKVEISAV